METTERNEHGLAFWIGLSIGVVVFGFGIRGALRQFDTYSSRFVYTKYVIGFDFLHDLIVAPIAFVVAFVVSRVAPHKLRGPLSFALFATAIAFTVGWYPLHHTAGYKGNATFQPLNYATAVATVVGVIWSIAAVWAAIAYRPKATSIAGGTSGQ